MRSCFFVVCCSSFTCFFFLEIVFKNSFPNVDHLFFIFAKKINADGRIIFSGTGSYLKLNFMMTLFDVGGSL